VTNPPRWVATWLEGRQRAGRGRPDWVRNLRRRIKRWNTRRTERAPLSRPMRERLEHELASEIASLESLLGRKLGSGRSRLGQGRADE
jgi:hypothetical protein